MIRLLLLFLILAAIGYGLSWYAKRTFRSWLQNMVPPGAAQGNTIESEQLVQCAKCNTFIPQSRAISGKDCYYCCQEHKDSAQ
jgi:hypothetical protein